MNCVTGRVVAGKLEVDDRPQLRRLINSLDGKPVEIIIRKRTTKRSLDQNAYIHAEPVTRLAEHLGYTIPEMKLVLMGECWGWKNVGGHELPVKPSTSDMTVEECSYFIDWVIPWAMLEHGVAVMLPDEWQKTVAA